MSRRWLLARPLLGPLLTTRGPDPGCVYLSFDDGPDPTHTAALLDLLARHGVKATFFVIGWEVQLFGHLLPRMVAEGHVLGNHSMRHSRFRPWQWRAQLDDLVESERLLNAADGRERHPFRPPHGRVTLASVIACRIRRQPMAMWTTDSRDSALPAADVIARLRATPIRGGEVLLFHDDSRVAIDVLTVLLPEWLRQGMRFGTL